MIKISRRMRCEGGRDRLGEHACFRGWGDCRGQGLAEYIIIVIVVAVCVILAIRYFGGSVFGRFESATNEIRTAGAGAEAAKTSEPERPAQAPEVAASSSGGVAATGGGDAGKEAGGRVDDGSSQDAVSQQVSRLSTDIGDDTQAPIESINLDWKTLGFIAGIIFAIGVFIVFRQTQLKDGEGKKKKKKRSALFSLKKSNEDGQAIAEFVIIAITFLFVILGVLQFAMILNAYSLVRYAAYNAARAAIVHGGDEEKMKEAARLSLVSVFPSHGRADHVRGFYENYLSAKATDDIAAFSFFNEPITKVEIIDSPSRNSGEVVTFDDPVDAEKAIITVRVTHLYELVIPLVNRMLFYVFRLNKNGPGYAGQNMNQISALSDEERRTGAFVDKELRLPLVGVYTMRLQSDYQVP